MRGDRQHAQAEQVVARIRQDETQFRRLMADNAPCAFIVPIDPEQTYFPKISSRITASGSMESNPIDRMTPEIDYLAEADVEA